MNVSKFAVLIAFTVARFANAGAPAPANDDFANAEVLSGAFPIAVVGSNVGATAESGEPAHGGETAEHSIWYTWTAPVGVTLTKVRFTGSEIQTGVSVYTGGAVNSLTPVAFGSNQFLAIGGTQYYIGVEGAGSAEGTVGIRLSTTTPAPPNDDLGNRVVLSTASVSTNGTCENATLEASEPNHASAGAVGSVWYEWTAPSNELFQFDTAGSPSDTALAVYTADPLSMANLVLIGENDDFDFGGGDELSSKVEFTAEAGETYYIAVGFLGSVAEVGDFNLNIGAPPPAGPPNDNFGDAFEVTALPVMSTSSNVSATTELGEPDHDGSVDNEHSIWWLFTSPTNGIVDINTEMSEPGLDTILAVYIGEDLEELTLLAQNNNFNLTNNFSRVFLTVTNGASYFIAVDGDTGEEGEITLEIEEVQVEILDTDANASTSELTLEWNSVAGANYDVLQSSNLISWLPFTNVVASATQTVLQIDVPTNLTHNAYSVGVEL